MIARVLGPGRPPPMACPSIATTGSTSRETLVMKASLASASSGLRTARCSTGSRPAATSRTSARVTPSRTRSSSV